MKMFSKLTNEFVALQCHYIASEVLVNTGSDNGLIPGAHFTNMD